MSDPTQHPPFSQQQPFSRYLPFSQRPRVDESAVSSNWSRHTGSVLLQLAELLDELGDQQWQRESMRSGWTIRETAGRLAWRIGASTAELAGAPLALAVRGGLTPAAAIDRLGREYSERSPHDLAARIRDLAMTARGGRGRRGMRDLSVAVLAAYDISHTVGTPLALDPIATGAVALARSLAAPLPIRAALTDRTLVAEDAGWTVGRGTAISGTAAGIILFLYGRGGLPKP